MRALQTYVDAANRARLTSDRSAVGRDLFIDNPDNDIIVILVAIMTITNDIHALLAQSDFLFASAAREAVGETLEQVPPLRAD